MRIVDVIGKATLSRCHPSLVGARWLVGVALNQDGLNGKASGRSEPFVIYDDMGAGEGSRIAISESAEAATPFYPDTKPIDAYNAAILDEIVISNPGD